MQDSVGVADSTYDLIIIGGGINGAGIARDAGMRGLRTLLLEASDFGSGTSSWSSRLIHGGLRYLEYAEIGLVRESLRERRLLLEQAPHLVRPLKLTIPIYRGARRGRLLIRLGMLAYDTLSFGKKLPAHEMLSREAVLSRAPALNAEGLVGAATYYDGQVSFAERLVLENILDACAHGVDARNYARVSRISARQDELHEVEFENADGTSGSARARVIVNAAGPWVDYVLSGGPVELPQYMGGTKGSHIVVGSFPGAPADAFYVEAQSDGRPFFILPWNDQVLIGTTDIRIEGDPADATASPEEIDYLLAETNRVFPEANLDRDAIHFVYSGVRPLPRQEKGPESAITRAHIIKHHDRPLDGVLSIIGGKLTTYRSLAEEAVDAVCQLLGKSRTRCPTRDALLPGAAGDEPGSLAELENLSTDGQRRLQSIYGGRRQELARLCRDEPELGRALNNARTVLAAEVALAIRAEKALTLIDIVHRRLMVGLAANYELALIEAIATVAAAEFGWSPEQRTAELEALAAYDARLQRNRTAAVT